MQEKRVRRGPRVGIHFAVVQALFDGDGAQIVCQTRLVEIVGHHIFGVQLLAERGRRQRGAVQCVLQGGAHRLIAHQIHGNAADHRHQDKHAQRQDGQVALFAPHQIVAGDFALRQKPIGLFGCQIRR